MIPPFLSCLAIGKERNPYEPRSSASPTPTHLAIRHWLGLSPEQPSGTQTSIALARAHEAGVSSARAFRACSRSCASMAVFTWQQNSFEKRGASDCESHCPCRSRRNTSSTTCMATFLRTGSYCSGRAMHPTRHVALQRGYRCTPGADQCA